MFGEVKVATHVSQGVFRKAKKLPELTLFYPSVSGRVKVNVDKAQRRQEIVMFVGEDGGLDVSWAGVVVVGIVVFEEG